MPLSSPAHDYPNRLAAAEPWRPSLPGRPWILLFLLLACLLPRAYTSRNVHYLCPDGVYYTTMAEEMAEGRPESYLQNMWLNPYPIVLMLLHQAGFDWLTATKLWGVVVASLAVLPIYGWIRRQFDDRVALVSALLYAVHPKFVECSSEALRDQTFWLLMALALYLSWRAATEVRVWCFLAAGTTITLAIQTRFEGWLLLVPLGLWTFWRFWALRTSRPKLVGGIVSAALVYPVLLLAVQTIWFQGYDDWRWGDFQRLRMVTSWVLGGEDDIEEPAPSSAVAEHTLVAAPPTLAAAEQAAEVTDQVEASEHQSLAEVPYVPTERMPFFKMLYTHFHVMERGLNAIFALLMFGAIWSWRHVWLRCDQQPIFYTSMLVALGAWIHLWNGQESSSRYALSIVILAAGYGGLGLLGLTGWLMRMSKRLPLWQPRPALVGWAFVLLIGSVQVTDAVTSSDPSRDCYVHFGQWWRAERGPEGKFLVVPATRQLLRYAGEEFDVFVTASLATAFQDMQDLAPDAVVLTRSHVDPAEMTRFTKQAAKAGWQPLAQSALSKEIDRSGLVVLVRSQGPRSAAVPETGERR